MLFEERPQFTLHVCTVTVCFLAFTHQWCTHSPAFDDTHARLTWLSCWPIHQFRFCHRRVFTVIILPHILFTAHLAPVHYSIDVVCVLWTQIGKMWCEFITCVEFINNFIIVSFAHWSNISKLPNRIRCHHHFSMRWNDKIELKKKTGTNVLTSFSVYIFIQLFGKSVAIGRKQNEIQLNTAKDD